MSINFGYGGYGMMNGVGANNMYGTNMNNASQQSFTSQYNCPMCYQHGPVPYNYQTYVNPLPKRAVNPSWFSKIFGGLFR